MIRGYLKPPYSLRSKVILVYLILTLSGAFLKGITSYFNYQETDQDKLYYFMEYFVMQTYRGVEQLPDNPVHLVNRTYFIDNLHFNVIITPQTKLNHQVSHTKPFVFHTESDTELSLLYQAEPDYNIQINVSRAELSHNIWKTTVEHIFTPVMLYLVVSIFLIALIHIHGFEPLTNLQRQIARREPNDLTFLPTQNLPKELIPFIDTLNGMFKQIKKSQEKQRQFVANAAHELRTPLTALNLQLHVLQSYLPDSNEAATSFKTVEQGLQRTQNLVNQMMSLAHQEANTHLRPAQLVSFTDTLKQCIEQLYASVEHKHIELSIEQLESINLFAHAEQINSIIYNLLDNAIKYTPQYGIINVALYMDKNLITLRIEDSGPGIPPHEIKKVFERFYRVTTNRNILGSGLGLAITKIAIQQLNGMIHLQPSELGGLLVTVTIPADIPASKPVSPYNA